MNPNIHTLTGAYAMDALDEFERHQFEAHLAECADCAREVRELRATTARLGMAVAEAPPDTLRERVLVQITQTRQESAAQDRSRRRDGSSRRPVNPWLVRLTAAAAVVAIGTAAALGAVTLHTGHQLSVVQAELDHARAVDQSVAQVLAAPDARANHGTTATGASGVVVFSAKLNRAVLLAANLPAVPANRVYQVWWLGAGNPRSAGLLPSGTAPLVFPGVPGASLVGITVEPAGGSAQPTTSPIMLMPA